MDKELIGRLLLIASIGLLIGGIIFLCVSIGGEQETTAPLYCAIGCYLLSNLFHVIRRSIGGIETDE